ncbi:acyltransferase family protein [Streptomyces sp. NPDC002845]
MDGLRAVGALLVLLVHLAGVTGMAVPFIDRFSVGVPIFFAISGYLLYRPWVSAALDRRPPPNVKAYYWHRFLRIVPGYWVLVAASVAVFYQDLLHEGGRLLRIVLLQHIIVVGDMPYEDVELMGTLTQTWSLATEVHFYLLLPLLGFGLHRLLTVRHGLAVACGLIAALEIGTLVWWDHVLSTPLLEQTQWWWLFGYLRYFAVGMVLAVVSVRTARYGAHPVTRALLRWPWLWWAAALAAHWLGSYLEPGTLSWSSQYYDLAVVVGLITPLVLAPGSGPERVMRLPVMAWLGRISYGVFLWHLFVLLAALKITGSDIGTLGASGFWALLPAALLASVALAWLSFVLVEDPLRRRLRVRAAARPPTTGAQTGRPESEPAAPAEPTKS